MLLFFTGPIMANCSPCSIIPFFTIISQVLMAHGGWWLTSSSNSSRRAELLYPSLSTERAEIHIILSSFHHENSCFPRDAQSSRLPPLFIFHFLSIHSQQSSGLRNFISPFDESNHAGSRNADDRFEMNKLLWSSQLFSIGEQSTGKINFYSTAQVQVVIVIQAARTRGAWRQ